MILLDTHVWLWWSADPKRLSSVARHEIEKADELAVSAISSWEIGMLVAHGRLELDRDVNVWLAQSLSRPKLRSLPITSRIALRSTQLEMHADPADRFIVATALEEKVSLITKDSLLRKSRAVQTIW